MAKHYKEKKSNLNCQFLLLIVFIILFIISLIKIIEWYKDNKENKTILQEVSEAVTINEDKNDNENKYNIDFMTLKEKNSDVVAWIKVNGTNIENTIVKTINNEYYLNHNLEKEYNEAGWFFIDYRNKLDGTDKNTVVYGHNRKDGSMFGDLKKILNQEWYKNEENLKINFITENEKNIYEVFSVYQIENEEYYIQTNFKTDNDYIKFLKTIRSRSINDFNIQLTSEDNILTLSTCANNNKDRIVLHAKKNKVK